jgi:hypothetical protein
MDDPPAHREAHVTASPQRAQQFLLVETARTLLASDDAWILQPYLRVTDLVEGHSQIAGNAVLEQPYGILLPEYQRKFQNIGVAPDIKKTGSGTLSGQLVRVLWQDPAGTITRGTGIYRTTYSARWWGHVINEKVYPDGAASPNTGGTVRWVVAGLASLLDSIRLRSGAVRKVDGSGVVDPGFLPPFNALSGGDRSSATMTVNGRTVYVHDLTTTTSGNLWTARQALDLVLALVLDPLYSNSSGPSGFTWQIADPDNCLAFTAPRINAANQTAATFINTICSPQRGLVWWVTASGVTATINVRSGLAAPITLPGYTIPASSKTSTINQADGPWIRDLQIEEDVSSTYDVIEVVGARPWVAITVAYDGTAGAALQKGWNPALEASWTGSQAVNTYRDVWRRFEVRQDWDGTQYGGGTGLRYLLARASDVNFGAEGYNGVRFYNAGIGLPSSMLIGEGALPCSPGFSTLRIGARQCPVVVVGSPSAGWIDMTGEWAVTVLNDPLAVFIDDKANGDILAGFIASGYQLLVTIGVREIQPLKASWQRDAATMPRAVPRTTADPDANFQEWVALQGCVTGVTAGGALTTLPSDVTARDDLPAALARLAMRRAWFGSPDIQVSWRNQATADLGDTYRAGTLLTTADRGDRSVAANAVIGPRRVQWVDRDGLWTYDTTYDCQRILPDTEMTL